MNFSNIEKIIPDKLKLKRKGILLKEEEIKEYNSNTIKKQIERTNLINKEKIRKVNTEPKKIKKGKNQDKIIIENGNQREFNGFNKIKELIDETNRLFLYKFRMNSTIGKHENKEENIKNQVKDKIIVYGNSYDVEDKIKDKIFRQINKLLKNKEKYN